MFEWVRASGAIYFILLHPMLHTLGQTSSRNKEIRGGEGQRGEKKKKHGEEGKRGDAIIKRRGKIKWSE